MIDLTGANLIAYLLRVIKDAVRRNPRFNSALGEVTHQYNNLIEWKDVQITIRDVTTSGTRLSPDYFMCNQYGRAILCKVENKEGSFIEWVTETDKTRTTPDAGVYYINVDSVDIQTNKVGLTIEKFRWVDGKYNNAQGSIAYLRPGIDGTTLTATDLATGLPVTIKGFSNYVILQQPTQTLQLYTNSSPPTPLTPMTDYWYQRNSSVVIVPNTIGGVELANIPGSWVSFTLSDQDDYELRKGIDWTFFGLNFIQLSQWTPSGSTITANVVERVDPSTVSGTNPENILQVGLLPNETLVGGQIFIHTNQGDYTTATANADGTVTLPVLLQPGDWLRWEMRINSGQTQATALKYNLNGNIIPGLYLAMGDSVVVDDQVAIIVSPGTTETYEIYGSKENLDFTLDVKANDLQTASDLSELLKQRLLVYSRENMEADGITIFEARRSYRGQGRDTSGTAPSFTYSVSISASADWKVYRPKVTRVASFEIIDTPSIPDFQGKLSMAPRVKALGTFQFVSWYS